MPKPKGRPKTGGRKRGTPNRATASARAAIAAFVDGNTHRLQDWLDKVANGVRGKVKGKKGVVYVVPPNPEKAFNMFQSLIEYHIPKQARIEATGKDGKELSLPPTFVIVPVRSRHQPD